MKNLKSKNLQVLHFILGLFFTIAGLFTLVKANYLFSIWIISLGLLFLFDTIKDRLTTSVKPFILDIIHYALAIIVLATGILTLVV